MEISLEDSFQFCRKLARREARNFYFSFLTLPRTKRDAMCVIYSWMRKLDDFADDAPSPKEARTAVEAWKTQTHQALESKATYNLNLKKDPLDLLWPAFKDTVFRYNIPLTHFDEITEGALMDQEICRYESFEELYRYCYRVASLVGLVSLKVFEYEKAETEKYGEWLGIAFQLTNILRDIPEDAKRGRIYIPLEYLRKHKVSEADILEGNFTTALHQLLEEFAAEIENYYSKASPIFNEVSPEARRTLKIMTEIYHGILLRLRDMDFQVFKTRARIPTWKKFYIVAKHQLSLSN